MELAIPLIRHVIASQILLKSSIFYGGGQSFCIHLGVATGNKCLRSITDFPNYLKTKDNLTIVWANENLWEDRSHDGR